MSEVFRRSFRCEVLSETKSAVLFRLLTQTLEAPKKEIGTGRMKNKQKEKAEKDDRGFKKKRNRAAVPLYSSGKI